MTWTSHRLWTLHRVGDGRPMPAGAGIRAQDRRVPQGQLLVPSPTQVSREACLQVAAPAPSMAAPAEPRRWAEWEERSFMESFRPDPADPEITEALAAGRG